MASTAAATQLVAGSIVHEGLQLVGVARNQAGALPAAWRAGRHPLRCTRDLTSSWSSQEQAGQSLSPCASEDWRGSSAATTKRGVFAEATELNAGGEVGSVRAVTERWWARMLTARGRPGDLERARALLEQARYAAISHGHASIERKGSPSSRTWPETRVVADRNSRLRARGVRLVNHAQLPACSPPGQGLFREQARRIIRGRHLRRVAACPGRASRYVAHRVTCRSFVRFRDRPATAPYGEVNRAFMLRHLGRPRVDRSRARDRPPWFNQSCNYLQLGVPWGRALPLFSILSMPSSLSIRIPATDGFETKRRCTTWRRTICGS